MKDPCLSDRYYTILLITQLQKNLFISKRSCLYFDMSAGHQTGWNVLKPQGWITSEHAGKHRVKFTDDLWNMQTENTAGTKAQLLEFITVKEAGEQDLAVQRKRTLLLCFVKMWRSRKSKWKQQPPQVKKKRIQRLYLLQLLPIASDQSVSSEKTCWRKSSFILVANKS